MDGWMDRKTAHQVPQCMNPVHAPTSSNNAIRFTSIQSNSISLNFFQISIHPARILCTTAKMYLLRPPDQRTHNTTIHLSVRRIAASGGKAAADQAGSSGARLGGGEYIKRQGKTSTSTSTSTAEASGASSDPGARWRHRVGRCMDEATRYIGKSSPQHLLEKRK